jgi:hypothetical protein
MGLVEGDVALDVRRLDHVAGDEGGQGLEADELLGLVEGEVDAERLVAVRRRRIARTGAGRSSRGGAGRLRRRPETVLPAEVGGRERQLEYL